MPQQKFLITLKAADKRKMPEYDEDDGDCDEDVQVYPSADLTPLLTPWPAPIHLSPLGVGNLL